MAEVRTFFKNTHRKAMGETVKPVATFGRKPEKAGKPVPEAVAPPNGDHPVAGIFPLMEGERFDELVEDIRVNGLKDAIVVHEGKILDGRNRDRACKLAGVPPRYIPYKGHDALAFVVSKNLMRRDLSVSQRAMIAAEIVTAKRGGVGGAHRSIGGIPPNPSLGPFDDLPPVTQPQAAKKLNVSEDSIKQAAAVQAHAIAPIKAAVKSGAMSLNAAAAVSKLDPAEQKAVAASGRAAAVAVAKVAREGNEHKLARRWLAAGPDVIAPVIDDTFDDMAIFAANVGSLGRMLIAFETKMLDKLK
jgi:hypothetical protein